ncbi:hypothetical protein BDZ89DRAFT_1071035 [Hymenopellis radicata]|nr:hypothetical protein BDZ89DRAFT_1071035 [Hymenopellis radicata]
MPLTPSTTLVYPENPVWTGPDPDTLRLVDGNDLVLQFVLNSCHVVPGPIDVERFCKAVGVTVGRFPHTAGRLKRDGDSWRVDLTNSPVPVTVVDDDTLTAPFPEEDRYHIIQKSILPFVCEVPMREAFLGEDVPLLSLKLTRLLKTGETVIGNSWNHTLGDGTTVHNFMHTLSQAYLGLELPPLPSYVKRKWPDPRKEMGLGDEAFKEVTPHVVQDFTLDELLTRYEKEAKEAIMMDLCFTKGELDAIVKKAKDGAEEGVKLSKQDALSSYVVSLHNRILERPIVTVMNLMNYRTRDVDPDALYRHPQSAGNCTITAFADVTGKTQLDDVPEMAVAIRKETNKCRTNDWTALYLMLNGYQFEQAIKSGRFHMSPHPGYCIINSLLGLDENGLRSFGYKGRSQYYTETSWERMFRVHPANPVRRADGAWDANQGSVVVSFRLRPDLKQKMLDMKKEDMAALGL